MTNKELAAKCLIEAAELLNNNIKVNDSKDRKYMIKKVIDTLKNVKNSYGRFSILKDTKNDDHMIKNFILGASDACTIASIDNRKVNINDDDSLSKNDEYINNIKKEIKNINNTNKEYEVIIDNDGAYYYIILELK